MSDARKILEKDEIGFFVHETDTHLVHVMEMIFSYRIVRTSKGDQSGPDRAWCYYGKDLGTFAKAVLAASMWDGADDSQPRGWDKDAMTGRYAEAPAVP